MSRTHLGSSTYHIIWRQFRKRRLGFCALLLFLFLSLMGVYAPFLASSKPLIVIWNKTVYFPLFRYLFFKGFFSKPIDIFFNLLMFTLPIFLGIIKFCPQQKIGKSLLLVSCGHMVLFFIFFSGVIKDPQADITLLKKRTELFTKEGIIESENLLTPFHAPLSWSQEIKYMSDYAKLNMLLDYKNQLSQNIRLASHGFNYLKKEKKEMPTLWKVRQQRLQEQTSQLKEALSTAQPNFIEAKKAYEELSKKYRPFAHEIAIKKFELEKTKQRLQIFDDHKHTKQFAELSQIVLKEEQSIEAIKEKAKELTQKLIVARKTISDYLNLETHLNYLNEKERWLEHESEKITVVLSALLRSFHWEEDAGGSQKMNQYVPWFERTRINRKDLTSSLLFGIRVSLVVGVSAVCLSLMIGIPLGTIAGYFAGSTDLIISRLVEVWEAMPTFFMLLLIVAMAQTKSIFLVIIVLGCFGWTGICRFIRAEVLKQRSMPYVIACKSLGFRSFNIMFSQILPNAIAPVLTLLPFSLMSTITSEAGLSFLGLGEEGSSSWGVLMDEGRSAFPAESYLLWPPALLLTILLICIALIGDVFRDALDPKMRR